MTSPIVDPVYEPPIRSAEIPALHPERPVFLFNPKNQSFIDGKTRKTSLARKHAEYLLAAMAICTGLCIPLTILIPFILVNNSPYAER